MIVIIDGHIHLFSDAVIENVIRKKNMADMLGFQTAPVRRRTGTKSLEQDLGAAGVAACQLLPTAKASGVRQVNDRCMKMAGESDFLYTAATLHPDLPAISQELHRLKCHGINGIKLCSFSQGFALDAMNTRLMLDAIRHENAHHHGSFFIILDTFFQADAYFGTPPENNPTPDRMGALVADYPEIVFVAAHMGGLTAPFELICDHLVPADNLYLDTSNAAHTLDETQFVQLLQSHGPDHIIFGTDWPWFDQASEMVLVERLMDEAGFSEDEQSAVFGKNLASLLGIG
ncbi:MAG: amidohydrolase family protein [Desulfatitalea sp.]|nr:amidohydrolase family protein [Desulfatitalea sp.]NNK01842.1 amidohydrolase family protein [Desulfatitalea sp.]